MENDLEKIRGIFAGALECSLGKQRNDFLDKACDQDSELRAKVEHFLSANDQAGTFLNSPAVEFSSGAATEKDEFLSEKSGSVIGRYKLLQKLGEGGFGAVYMAEQTKPLLRRVALKIIKLGMDTKQVIGRFEAERQALAMMDHPNIAKVLDAGSTETGRPYFVMELVRGVPITEYCDTEKLSIQKRLELFTRVCQAVQHAHQKGIIHRDLKPNNVLVTLHDGVPVPKVIDFGIAKATQQKLTDITVFTQLQQFVGTPAYMSPEQAEMSGLDIDTRSDIYSLGVLLYELLTGFTPFDTNELLASGIDAMRRTIREQEPVRPSTRLSQTFSNKASQSTQVKRVTFLASDLDWIVMKCLEKDRTRRYETANGLAVDIDRHLGDEPVVARPPSLAYRLQKAWRRNKLVYSAGVAVMTSQVVGLSMSLWQTRQAMIAQNTADQATIRAQDSEYKAQEARGQEEKAREEAELHRLEAENQRDVADREREKARRNAYASDMNLAHQSIRQGNYGMAAELLDRNRPSQGEKDLRGWEWRYLWQLRRSDALKSMGRMPAGVVALAVSANGQHFAATTGRAPGVQIRTVQTGELVSNVAKDIPVKDLAYHPDQNLLAISGKLIDENKSEIRLLNLDSGEEEWRYDGVCIAMDFSNDGTRIGCYLWPPTIVIVDVKTGKEETRYPLQDWSDPKVLDPFLKSFNQRGYFAPLTFGVLSPDGRFYACSDFEGNIRYIDLENQTNEWSWNAVANGHSDLAPAVCLEFSSNGESIAAAVKNNVLLFECATGRVEKIFQGHTHAVSSIKFLENDQKILTAGMDYSLRLWEVESQRQIAEWIGSIHELWCAELVPQSSLVLTGGKDGELMLWDTKSVSKRRNFIKLPSSIAGWGFNPIDDRIITVDAAGNVQERRPPDFHMPVQLMVISERFEAIALSPDGNNVAVYRGEKQLEIWNLHERQIISEPVISLPDVERIEYVSGGLALGIESSDNQIELFDRNGVRKSLLRFPSEGLAHWVYSVKAQRALTIHQPPGQEHQPLATLWNTKTGNWSEIKSTSLGSGPVSNVSLSAAADLVSVTTDPGISRLYTLPDLDEIAQFSGHTTGIITSAFSPDGTRIATAVKGGSQAVTLWDLRSENPLLSLQDPGQWSPNVEFSASGNHLAFGSADGLSVWYAPTLDWIDSYEHEHELTP